MIRAGLDRKFTSDIFNDSVSSGGVERLEFGDNFVKSGFNKVENGMFIVGKMFLQNSRWYVFDA